MNNRKDVHIFNKKEFNDFFRDFRSITWMDCSTPVSFEDFSRWLDGKKYVMLKAPSDTCGRGVHKLDLDECDVTALYSEYFPSRYLFEDYFVQDGILSEINSASLNTLRVYTLTGSDGKPYIPYAILRMGVGTDYRDNAHAGGLFAPIDVRTGIITGMAMNYENEMYPFHPLSGVRIVGRQIPRWEQVKETVLKCAEKVSGIRYCGWDVAVNSDNITMIEGNENGDFMIEEVLLKDGLWPFYKNLMKQYKSK